MQEWIPIGFLIIALLSFLVSFLGLLIKLLRLLIEYKCIVKKTGNEDIPTSTSDNREINTLSPRPHKGKVKKITNND